MKLNTINVLESPSGFPNQLTAYPNTKEGNAAAEEKFKELVRIVGDEQISDEELNEIVDDGYFSNENGDELFLIHSS